jgi:D-alanyl-D-alanine carboxypeptidase
MILRLRVRGRVALDIGPAPPHAGADTAGQDGWVEGGVATRRARLTCSGAMVEKAGCVVALEDRRAGQRLGALVLPIAAMLAVAAGVMPAIGSAPSTSGACVKHPYQVATRPQNPGSVTHSLPAELVSRLDEAAEKSLKNAASPGAIVGVRTPQGTWTKAYGVANPATGRPMAVGMHTRIGSVTKTFTGTVLLQLAQQGNLSLDDPISKYVAGVPHGARITLRMLANMTSGVASYTLSPDFTDQYFAHPETIFRPPQLIASGIAKSPIFTPGAKFDYSNTNTVLLGRVIEKVTDENVGKVFRQRIFKPLGLTDTVWPWRKTFIPKPYPHGFTLQGDTATPDHPADATHWNPAWGWTAGELISNMPDLLTYGRALGTGQGLLSPRTQVERLTSFPRPAGYGLALGCVDGWVGHTGELPGYNTSVFYDTTSDTTVIVQTNSDIASGNCPESPTLNDNAWDLPCSAPATRIFVAISTALGHTFTPPPIQ